MLAQRLNAATTYLVDLKRQYAGNGNHLAMVSDVLASLIHNQEPEFTPGSDRQPDPQSKPGNVSSQAGRALERRHRPRQRLVEPHRLDPGRRCPDRFMLVGVHDDVRAAAPELMAGIEHPGVADAGRPMSRPS